MGAASEYRRRRYRFPDFAEYMTKVEAYAVEELGIEVEL